MPDNLDIHHTPRVYGKNTMEKTGRIKLGSTPCACGQASTCFTREGEPWCGRCEVKTTQERTTVKEANLDHH